MPITIQPGAQAAAVFQTLKARAGEVDTKVSAIVANIIADVAARGDAAVREGTLRFDKADLAAIEVPRAQIEAAIAACDPAYIEALRDAAQNIREFHQRQVRQSFIDARPDGVLLGQRVRPLHRVGVYVPGGTAILPSSVLMNVLPAKVAGVPEVVMTTPAWQGGADPRMLAAAAIAGVDRVFLAGGAYAVAAMAYGTNSIPKVDKITGPGNIFVATAKKLLYGVVDIDMIAGPSEILIVADETANPRFLAADLLSQAEHDKLASAVLLTTSRRVAEQTLQALTTQLAALPRRAIAAEALQNYGAILVCDSLAQALALANDYAPEHMELALKNPLEHLGAVENAGSVFLGHFTPESVGDYCAGPNHVLPTGGTPRFFSPLSVDDFIKKTQFIHYTQPALAKASSTIAALANAEGLQAHANAAAIRFAKEE
jgi:histidinol dehydrogenase